MLYAQVKETASGRGALQIVLKVDAAGVPLEGVDIPLEAVASYRELLGIDDPAEVIEALLHMAEHGEPNPDPVTGENVYTEAYQLLRLREQAREDAALEVKEHEGHTDHQLQVAAAQMAYRAVHEPLNGGECAMDRCRREARGKLGLPDPTKKCGADSRTSQPPMPVRLPAQARMMRPAGGKAQALDILADHADDLHECTKQFLHSLSTHDTDPLENEPAPVPNISTPEQTLAKYQGAEA